MNRLEEIRNRPLPQMKSKAAPYGRQITRHIERTIGAASMVFHDVLSNGMPLDIHVIAPRDRAKTPARPFGGDFFTLVTSGLSTLPTETRRQRGTPKQFLELMISLPATWPGLNADGTLDARIMDDERYAWPLLWLKHLACLPPESGGVLVPHHCMPPREGAQPLVAETELRYLLLASSALHPKSCTLMVHDDIQIQFQALWPLYAEEAAFVRHFGAESLLSELHREGVTDLVNPRRLRLLTPAKHRA